MNQEALRLKLNSKETPFEPRKQLPIYYKGRCLEKEYYADMVCYDKIIVELKAMDRLTSKEESQILNYLKASRMKVGVLINFGALSLEWKRFVL